jgi:hypothetical protein
LLYNPSLEEPMPIPLIEQRLDRLEQQIRFWKVLTIIVAVVSVAALVSRASAKPLRIDATAVVAEEFDLANPNGRIMARLVPDPADSNAPALLFKYPNNKAAAIIGVSNGGPSVTLFDTAGNSRALLAGFSNGPSLSLLDTDGNLRVLIHAQNKKPEAIIYGNSISDRVWVAPTAK